MTPSTPAVLRPALSCVTRRTETSTFARDRNIRRCRLRTRLWFASFAAVKIRCLSARTSASTFDQTMSGHQSKRSSAGLFAEASNIPRSSLRIRTFRSRLTWLTSARFPVQADARYPGGYRSGGCLEGQPRAGAFPSAFRRPGVRFLSHPVPATPISVPLRARPPALPARDGVSVFHTLQTRPGRVPSIPRGRWCPRIESLTSLMPPAGPSPAGPCHPRHLPTEGLNVNEGSSTVHLRSPIQAFPLPTRRRQTDDELRLFPWASHPVVTNDARHGGDGPAGHWPELHAAPVRAPPPIHAVTESVRPHVAPRAT